MLIGINLVVLNMEGQLDSFRRHNIPCTEQEFVALSSTEGEIINKVLCAFGSQALFIQHQRLAKLCTSPSHFTKVDATKMSFKREGNDADWLANLKKRRISDLLSEGIPEDEAYLMKNGRFACMVCPQRPVFDTIAMLMVHRQARKHTHHKEQFSAKKYELDDLKVKVAHEHLLRTGTLPKWKQEEDRVKANSDGFLDKPKYDPRVRKSRSRPDEQQAAFTRQPVISTRSTPKTPSSELRLLGEQPQTIAEYSKQQRAIAACNLHATVVRPYVSKKRDSSNKPKQSKTRTTSCEVKTLNPGNSSSHISRPAVLQKEDTSQSDNNSTAALHHGTQPVKSLEVLHHGNTHQSMNSSAALHLGNVCRSGNPPSVGIHGTTTSTCQSVNCTSALPHGNAFRTTNASAALHHGNTCRSANPPTSLQHGRTCESASSSGVLHRGKSERRSAVPTVEASKSERRSAVPTVEASKSERRSTVPTVEASKSTKSERRSAVPTVEASKDPRSSMDQQMPSTESSRNIKVHKYLQAITSGWKRDRGSWIKDEDAEFDSDDEPPDIA